MDTRMLEPLAVPEVAPPERSLSPGRWVKENLFSTWFNGVLTVLLAALLGWALYKIGRFVFVDARWEIVEVNLTNILVFRFPRDELWRLWAGMFVLAAAFGVGAGVAARLKREEEGGGGPGTTSPLTTLRRLGPLIAVAGVFLWFAKSVEGTLLVLAIAAVWGVARFAGLQIPPRRARWAGGGVLLAIVLAYVIVTSFGGVGWSEGWGGLLLTVFLAAAGIAISFPLGVLLALGRRSSLPAVRIVCITYIELVRGVPLITLLFLGAFMLGFFLPPGSDTPSLETRALVALVLFTAAYVAEIVRGGLQAVPRDQTEAAQALGLSPLKTTRLIVLPQALRAVIPALVGQFISLFKDTSLVFIIGLTELLAVSELITKQPEFLAEGLIIETLVFAGFVYWGGSYWMSRESQRLERRLGVGER
ncbi:MAG TPA: amino acid ABC transporter permease [Gaiellaceae bacterium]|nr:amino acid ABC transporter permease [Gaiellaceae bacterium]